MSYEGKMRPATQHEKHFIYLLFSLIGADERKAKKKEIKKNNALVLTETHFSSAPLAYFFPVALSRWCRCILCPI